mmetsp:Transcript_13080/g.31815  ORF Transcript_13080/g.31815 Transcript_13080/m.31815 type:complete len:341 (-) Transcript_13080:763-1785(-)
MFLRSVSISTSACCSLLSSRDASSSDAGRLRLRIRSSSESVIFLHCFSVPAATGREVVCWPWPFCLGATEVSTGEGGPPLRSSSTDFSSSLPLSIISANSSRSSCCSDFSRRFHLLTAWALRSTQSYWASMYCGGGRSPYPIVLSLKGGKLATTDWPLLHSVSLARSRHGFLEMTSSAAGAGFVTIASTTKGFFGVRPPLVFLPREASARFTAASIFSAAAMTSSRTRMLFSEADASFAADMIAARLLVGFVGMEGGAWAQFTSSLPWIACSGFDGGQEPPTDFVALGGFRSAGGNSNASPCNNDGSIWQDGWERLREAACCCCCDGGTSAWNCGTCCCG